MFSTAETSHIARRVQAEECFLFSVEHPPASPASVQFPNADVDLSVRHPVQRRLRDDSPRQAAGPLVACAHKAASLRVAGDASVYLTFVARAGGFTIAQAEAPLAYHGLNVLAKD